MGSIFGRLFQVSTFGESHGKAVGCVIEGCPPGIRIDFDRVREEMNRRRPGQSEFTSGRNEEDHVEILSGIHNEISLGTPICMMVHNRSADSEDYENMAGILRPSHADFTYRARYKNHSVPGGGRASARETVGRVAAGAIAGQVLDHFGNIEIIAWVDRVMDIGSDIEPDSIKRENVEKSPIRCPDPEASKKMEELILKVKKEGDSVGGVVRCIIRGLPAGLGDPVFDKLDADLGKAMLSIPACTGFEKGNGFAGTLLKGSENNDLFKAGKSGLITETNRSGGIQGGISNGMPILFSAAFKATPTIMKKQKTIDEKGNEVFFRPSGNHDPCVLPRAVPVVEAMACLVIADHWLMRKGLQG